MIIDFFRKVIYVLLTRGYFSNPKSGHNGDKATGGDIRLQVLQKDHVVTAKAITQLIFNTKFNVRLRKIKGIAMKGLLENIIKDLIDK